MNADFKTGHLFVQHSPRLRMLARLPTTLDCVVAHLTHVDFVRDVVAAE